MASRFIRPSDGGLEPSRPFFIFFFKKCILILTVFLTSQVMRTKKLCFKQKKKNLRLLRTETLL